MYSDKNKEVLSLQRQKKRVELALVQHKISNFAEDNPDMLTTLQVKNHETTNKNVANTQPL